MKCILRIIAMFLFFVCLGWMITSGVETVLYKAEADVAKAEFVEEISGVSECRESEATAWRGFRVDYVVAD